MTIKKGTPHKCPVCGKTVFPHEDSFEVCDECGWEDDALQERNPDDTEGANEMSLNEYKARYEAGWRPDWLDDIDDEEEQ